MHMKKYIETLRTYIEQHPPNCGDADSALGMLYECHNENNPYDNEQIRTDFNELYQQMNGMPCGRWIKSSILSVSSAGIMKRLVLSKGFVWVFS